MYTIFMWETAKPKYCIVYCFDDQSVGVFLERQCVDYSPYSFFYRSYVSFYFWDMFVATGDV